VKLVRQVKRPTAQLYVVIRSGSHSMKTGQLSKSILEADTRQGGNLEPVEIFGIRFPRTTSNALIAELLTRIESGLGGGICFPDMSTMNLVVKDTGLRKCLQKKMEVYNDGAGLGWAARQKGKPFPDNLNGTDLVPKFLSFVPKGTRVYVVGGRQRTVNAAVDNMKQQFANVDFVGWHHGYLDNKEEAELVRDMQSRRPHIVLVAMGNPLQIRFIARHKDKPGFDNSLFLAVGGLLHYFSGELRRAPRWMRRYKLEWLFITLQQPYKFKRYFLGIPRFFYNFYKYEIRSADYRSKVIR